MNGIPQSVADIPVALLAGGLATRLGSISRQIPKALVDIDGRPFIDHQLELLHRHGIRRVVMCVGHLGQMIEEHLGDGSRFGMEICFSYDGPELAGTGGAIRRALPVLGELFWVMYGDSYMDIDYAAVLQSFADSAEISALGVMTVIQNDDQWDKSNAVFENGRLARYDKRQRTAAMRHIDYGVQLLRREALQDAPPGRFDLSDLYCDLVSRRQMVGYEVFNRFYEIGTPGALEETRRYLANHPLFQEPKSVSFTSTYLSEAAQILSRIDHASINRMVSRLMETRNQNGRIFFLGIGGSAANASHAVNDFRKICGFEAYAPTDNVSEFSARTNDDGWDTVFASWLKGSRLNARDMVFVLSVGGGDIERNISPCLVRALEYAKEVHATIVGIVGRDGGYTAKVANACVIIPTINPTNVTPHAEAFQAIVWHLLVSHPALKASLTKWEAVAA